MSQNDNDKIWITISYTINVGSYESLKIESGFSRTIEDGESPYPLLKKHTARLLEQTKEQVKETKDEIRRLKRKKFDE